ncbi:hypothetical protein [uncultured Draconibacterium sp.]|uniref:hypothetical protein n=1 Tax=uncultured Draconibacterium sp. TaxID=1573823 RepID=UPI0032172C2A
MDFNILIKGTSFANPEVLKKEAPGKFNIPPDPNEIIRLMQYIEVKDKRNQELSETIGELKYENKLLRTKLGYNNGTIAAEDPKK